jgi:glycosyltransferase involved in cell wall biosynthesis
VSRPILVVGPGARFLSGISYVTAALVRAFAEHGPGSAALLIRQLCPARIYPGRDRIGKHPESVLDFADAPVHVGLDWFWGPRIVSSLSFLWRQRPSVLLLQWWTGTAAHTYILLALVSRLRGARVVLEFHETLDVGEAAIPPVRAYVKAVMRLLLRCSDGVVVHSPQDIAAVHECYPTSRRLPLTVIPHGPVDHLKVTPTPPTGVPRLVFFGVLRDYKGLDELADAYERLCADGHELGLTIAGEPWDETLAVLDRFRQLPGVALRLGHLDDAELTEVLGDADLLVLPYRRSSASGPLHTAMSLGLPVVTTSLVSLRAATEDYTGVRFAEPGDSESLAQAILVALPLIGTRHKDPHSWEVLVGRYRTFFATLGGR